MAQATPQAWGLWSTTPEGRYLYEAWQLRREFPLVCAGPRNATSQYGLEAISNWPTLRDDPWIATILLAVPLAERAALVFETLEAGKSVIVEGWPTHSEPELSALEEAMRTSGQTVGTIFATPGDQESRLAESALLSGRLGDLRRITWIHSEFTAPAGQREEISADSWRETFSRNGGHLLTRLIHWIKQSPQEIWAWPCPATAGFQLRLKYAGELVVWLEAHTHSCSDLRTGWVVEGSDGAYSHGKLMSLAADGELRSEMVTDQTEHVTIGAELARLADSNVARASWTHTKAVAELFRRCLAAFDDAAKSASQA